MFKFKLLILSIVLYSCNLNSEELVISDYDKDVEQYKVFLIKPSPFKTHPKETSLYYLETFKSYAFYKNRIIFVDSSGKFNIGDTVYLNFNKK